MGNDYTVLYRLIHNIRYLLKDLPEMCINEDQEWATKLNKDIFRNALTDQGLELYDTNSAQVTSRYDEITISVDYYQRRFQIEVKPSDAQPGEDAAPLFIKDISIPFNKIDTVHQTLTRLISECSNGILTGIGHQVAYSVTFSVDGNYSVYVDRTPFVTRLLGLLKPEIGYFKQKIEDEELQAVAITYLPLAHSGSMVMANSFKEVITSKPLTIENIYISEFIVSLSQIRYGKKCITGNCMYFTVTNTGFVESEKRNIKGGA